MGGDKIVLLDGAGANGGGAATNGLLSMIPGMFANLIGGNKMDPNLVAALMNGRNNQDGFGGANGWWLWIIVLFWLWGGRGFGNGFGNGGDCCANGLPAQLNNDYGRELLMQAIQGNRSAIDQIASALNCSTTQLQNAICNVQGAIDKVAGQVGMTSQAVINAVQQQRWKNVKTSWKKEKEDSKNANAVMKWRTGNTGGWVTNLTRPIIMETTDTTVMVPRCVEVGEEVVVVLIEEQTQRIQLIRNM